MRDVRISRRMTGQAADSHQGKSWEKLAWRFGPAYLGAALVPTAGAAAHVAWGGQPVATPLATLGLAGGTLGLSLLAHKIGKVREQIVRWHTTTTVALAGSATTLGMILGYPHGLRSVLLQLTLGMGALTAFSWNLRRLDSLRQDGASKDEQDTWAKQLGLGNVRPGTAKQLGARVEIPLKHGLGDTVGTIQKALPAIEAAAGVPAGRSRVIEDPDNAARSTLVLVTEDVLKDTIRWPGPSAPGESIAVPISAGTYEDGVREEICLPGRPGVAPSNMGYMGMTRAGKTMYALIFFAEVFTRFDVVVWWADMVKGAQTADPIREGLEIYADNAAKGKAMLKALVEVVRARADLLGKHGFRQWEPACYTHPELRMPFLIAHFEEADEIMTNNPSLFIWLTSKALSTGVSVSTSLQRADHVSMPTTARANVGTWACFGVGDDYSAGFALSQSTIDAGAHPEKWKARRQGLHYLEANGVDETRFPIPAKGDYATDAEISAVVSAWAPRMAKSDPCTVAAAGEFYRSMTGGAITARPAAKEIAIPVTSDDESDKDISDLVEEVRSEMPAQPSDELLVTPTNPATPIAPWTGVDMKFGSKPEALTQQEAEDAFDEVLRSMVDEGIEEFQVDDLVKRYPYRQRPWASKRLSRMCNGELVLPPGMSLERMDTLGRYRIEHLMDMAGSSNAR